MVISRKTLFVVFCVCFFFAYVSFCVCFFWGVRAWQRVSSSNSVASGQAKKPPLLRTCRSNSLTWSNVGFTSIFAPCDIVWILNNEVDSVVESPLRARRRSRSDAFTDFFKVSSFSLSVLSTRLFHSLVFLFSDTHVRLKLFKQSRAPSFENRANKSVRKGVSPCEWDREQPQGKGVPTLHIYNHQRKTGKYPFFTFFYPVCFSHFWGLIEVVSRHSRNPIKGTEWSWEWWRMPVGNLIPGGFNSRNLRGL